MNILGGIIFLILGIAIIIFAPKVLKYKKNDYSKYKVTTGTVYHMHNFFGNRWIVGFIDENGKEVLGMDDVISYDTFSSNRYSIPKFGTKEKVYYWKYDNKSQFSIDDKKVEYYIHFCNENLYDLQKTKKKNHSTLAVIFGIVLAVIGIVIFFFG